MQHSLERGSSQHSHHIKRRRSVMVDHENILLIIASNSCFDCGQFKLINDSIGGCCFGLEFYIIGLGHCQSRN